MPMSQTEAHRLAASINALRPDWPLASLSTFIRTKLADKAYRDATVALAWIATDEKTTTPARVLEAGPWWRAATAGDGTVSAISQRCPVHPDQRAGWCLACEDEAAPPETVPDLAAAVRAEYRTRTRRTPRPEPTPDRTRIEQIRAELDAEEAQK